MLRILFKFGDKVLQTIESDKRELFIGRNPDSDIRIDNLGVSDRHARIFEHEGRYTIEDLDSTNGTFVNEKRITRAVLEVNSEILIGKHSLIIQDSKILRKPPESEKTMKLETRQY
jgi:pSer/pThr/pTyr-binding forkhead associated (FHA) protein